MQDVKLCKGKFQESHYFLYGFVILFFLLN